MRKKLILLSILCLSLLPLSVASEQAGFLVGFNVDFPNYQSAYIGPSFSYVPTINSTNDLELNLGATLGIHKLENAVEFIVPVKIGLNFLFPDSGGFLPYMGVGLMPSFAFASDRGLQMIIGPYISGGFRVRLLPLLSYFLELDQTLLIGPPAWINTSTRVTSGLSFRVAQ